MARLDTKEAAKYIPCAKSTLDKLRVKGGGPIFIQIGKRVLYETDDLDRWLVGRKRASTSADRAPSSRRRLRKRHDDVVVG
jgi:hypothetical protein